MRVLIVSKFKQFQGGVESHISELTAGLMERGHEVAAFTSEDVLDAGGHVFSKGDQGATRIHSAVSLIWNAKARESLEETVDRFRPDVIHYHSIYHQLSPSVLGVSSTPAVMTLHDYKLAAPCYTLFREGQICTECVGSRFPRPAIKYRCIGNSAAGSALCSAEQAIATPRYLKTIRRFIVPSEFSRRIMLQAGVPDEKLTKISWGVAPTLTGPGAVETSTRKTLAFIGRLHETKGLKELLDAWSRKRADGLQLLIAGAGQLHDLVLSRASADPSISYLGHLDAPDLERLRRQVDLVVVPSSFPETMGLSAIECLITGVPIVVSNRGALADLAGPGVAVLPELTADAIAERIDLLYADDAYELRSMKFALAERDLSLYSRTRMVDEICATYENALLSAFD
ncbi:glycosyltransferase family 4 protein [Microbacterium testaceum]|uniref:glycosyltransferase family 4 protein n=1 Tax=Microbacterium testaceum TaxID=2033 RepID=UPI0012ACFBD9|nr:glycosyltransferase family 4 protein [Microbacterium testaceum]